jgi:pilus assembly protein Flp/PilA
MMLKLFASLAVYRHALVARLDRDEDGVTALEYGLIAALIAAVIIGAVALLGTEIREVFDRVATAISNAGSD